MTMKKTLVALTSLTLAPAGALAAYSVGSPIGATSTVTATTYYSSGAFHGAVDIAGGVCGSTGVSTAVVGSMAWNVTIRTSAKVCDGNGSGNQNEVAHTFSSGYTFRIWHFNQSSGSYDRTCDRCTIGTVGGTGNATGPHAHLQYDRYGTNNTAWYSGTSKGESLSFGEVVGSIE